MPRHYPSLAKPISLMALDYTMARERVPQRYPFFRSTFFERRMLFARALPRWHCVRRPEARPAPRAWHGRRAERNSAGARNRLPNRQRSRKLACARGRSHAQTQSQPEEWQMSADGTWKLSMQTPIGERKSTLALKTAGGTVTGKLTADEGASTDIFEGKANGDNVTFKAAIKSPMPLTLEFTASVDG